MMTNTKAPTNQVEAFAQTNKLILPFATHALTNQKCGFHIFPLVPNAKTPLTPNGYKDASNDVEVINEWVKRFPNANIGIATQPSGLIVIDCDASKGKTRPTEWDLPGVTDGADVLATVAERYGAMYPSDTYNVNTPNDGLHYYFRDSGNSTKSCAQVNGLWLVDVRSRGGYIVASGSALESGIYQAGLIEEILPLPEWLRQAITPKPLLVRPTPHTRITRTSKTTKSSQYVEAGIRNQVALLASAGVGTRNDTLNTVAFACARLVAQCPPMHSFVWQALTYTALAIGLSEQEAARTIKSAYFAGMEVAHV
jgi:hypothetical protein